MSIADIPLTRIAGEVTSLRAYAGKVLLIVNVASRCGHAPQYARLEELQRTYGDRGFVVLGFPSNQFFQELGSTDAIAAFCQVNYGVTFPLFAPVRVNGRGRHPLFAELTQAADDEGTAGKVQWNFEKFLLMPDGTVRRFRTTVQPDDPRITSAIESALSPTSPSQ